MRIIDSIDEYNALFCQETLHPLVTVGDLSKADRSLFTDEETDFGMYSAILIDEFYGDIIRDQQCSP